MSRAISLPPEALEEVKRAVGTYLAQRYLELEAALMTCDHGKMLVAFAKLRRGLERGCGLVGESNALAMDWLIARALSDAAL